MEYTYKGQEYILIDTPGHVDFRTKFLDLLRLAKGHLIVDAAQVYKHKQFQFIFGAKTTWKLFRF
jgi:translation elongation factor EF-4